MKFDEIFFYFLRLIFFSYNYTEIFLIKLRSESFLFLNNDLPLLLRLINIHPSSDRYCHRPTCFHYCTVKEQISTSVGMIFSERKKIYELPNLLNDKRTTSKRLGWRIQFELWWQSRGIYIYIIMTRYERVQSPPRKTKRLILQTNIEKKKSYEAKKNRIKYYQ